jgi:hypothetical protein
MQRILLVALHSLDDILYFISHPYNYIRTRTGLPSTFRKNATVAPPPKEKSLILEQGLEKWFVVRIRGGDSRNQAPCLLRYYTSTSGRMTGITIPIKAAKWVK